MHGFLNDIVIAIIAATATGIIFYLLRQPVIVAYLLAGIIIGPEIGPTLIKDPANIAAISEIGLCLLLFIAGLEINIKNLRAAGKSVLVPGIGQFPLSVAAGALFFTLAGFAFGREMVYLSVACALSSTAIVLKSLQDERQSDTFHAQVALVILVMQDIWGVMALILLPSSGNGAAPILLAVGKTVLLFAGTLAASRYIMKFIFQRAAKTPEMTVAISIGWCALISASAGGLGLSPALGALAAGVSISIFPYHLFVIDKVQPLRDIFLILFFVSLGMQIPVPDATLLVKVAVVIVFIVISRFAVIYPLSRLTGGGIRTGFLASIDLAQVSEFSLVIMMAGLAAGQVSRETFSVVLYAMVITAIGSSYAIRYGYPLYSVAQKIFRLREKEHRTNNKPAEDHAIIILGLHRGSQAVIEMIARKSPELLKELLVIDYNAEVLKDLKRIGVSGHLGDISRAEVLEQAGAARAKIIVATIPEMLIKGIDSVRLVRVCSMIAPDALIIASADFKNRVVSLEEAGADKVILPYFLAGEQCADFIISQTARRRRHQQ